MKRKKGFTLIELIIAILIFSFMIVSMSSIYSAVTRHMYQNYRQNAWKINTALAIRTIQQNLLAATRIDAPAPPGSPGDSGNDLTFAVNVDQLTGCYPISPGDPATLHKFCHLNGVLYYYTSTLAGGGGGCGTPTSLFWAGAYPACGSGGGGGWTSVQLLDHVTPGIPLPIVPVFSRLSAQGVNERDTVAVNLKIHWDPSVLVGGGDLSATQRAIDYSLKTIVKINCPAL